MLRNGSDTRQEGKLTHMTIAKAREMIPNVVRPTCVVVSAEQASLELPASGTGTRGDRRPLDLGTYKLLHRLHAPVRDRFDSLRGDNQTALPRSSHHCDCEVHRTETKKLGLKNQNPTTKLVAEPPHEGQYVVQEQIMTT